MRIHIKQRVGIYSYIKKKRLISGLMLGILCYGKSSRVVMSCRRICIVRRLNHNMYECHSDLLYK
jgi:hypothetical protein